MQRRLILVLILAMVAGSVFAADLTISTQVNVTAPDYASNFFTFKGLVGASEKDQYVQSADATSGASKLESTVTFNPYRTDVKGKKLLPAGLRGLFLYGIADFATRTNDALNVSAAPSGVITIQSVHRGTAYKIVTDTKGVLAFPGGSFSMRAIGTTANLIHSDFSSSGKVGDIDWGKVWDASVADGKAIGTAKTGKIAADAPASELFAWEGSLAVSFDGTYLKLSGELNAVKR